MCFFSKEMELAAPQYIGGYYEEYLNPTTRSPLLLPFFSFIHWKDNNGNHTSLQRSCNTKNKKPRQSIDCRGF